MKTAIATMKKAARRAAGTAALCLALLPCLGSTASPYKASVDVSWTTGVLRAEVEMDVEAVGARLPSGRSEAERLLATQVPELVRGAVLGLGLDSRRTVADSLEDGSLDSPSFEAFLEGGRRTRSSLSRDMTRLLATYEWRLADLAVLYVRHTKPVDQAAPDAYAPTRPYSGLVVYVQGEFPVRGEHLAARLEPCLFPRIYDEGMTPLLDRNLMDPAALRAWGSVAYATSLSDPVIEERAGDEPLRVMAYQVFGSRRSDVVVMRQDALRILASPENRELVRSGKVVFVIDPAKD